MSRRDLELRAKKELEASGYLVERAVSKAIFTPKGFVARSFDFFNCFDLIAVRGSETRFIQITSSDVNNKNPDDILRKHKRKIDQLWPETLPDPEIFYYKKENGRWVLNLIPRWKGEWVDLNILSESITGDLRGMNPQEGKMTPGGKKK